MATVLIAPVLPRVQAAFRALPGVEALVPLMLTVPALCVAALAPFAGAIVDRLGRVRLLLGALLLYGLAGTAPLWLQSLYGIIASRVLIGVADAGIMTCSTTLLGDYFEGARRERLLAQQTIWVSLGATLFFVLGGALGEGDWRRPFWLYSLGLLLLPVLGLRLREPEGVRRGQPLAARERFPWPPLAAICALTLAAAVPFFAVQIHLGFLLDAMGEGSTRRIGQAIGIGSVATVIGAALYPRLARLGVARHLALGFAIQAAGYLRLAGAADYGAVVLSVIVQSLGAGMLLPALLNWAMRQLRFAQRGRGTGIWTASFFLGQFLCPLAVLGLSALAGGLAAAFALLGVASAVLGCGALGAGWALERWRTAPGVFGSAQRRGSSAEESAQIADGNE